MDLASIAKILYIVKKINLHHCSDGCFFSIDVNYQTGRVLVMKNSETVQKVVCETADESLVMARLKAIF